MTDTTLPRALLEQALGERDRFRAELAARRAALAQQAEPDWQDLYLKEKQRADMWRNKYESVAGAEQRIYLQAEPVEPVAGCETEADCTSQPWCRFKGECLRKQAEPGQGLCRRLHNLSKALEGSGRIDQHDHPDAYATILDAMVMAQKAEPEEWNKGAPPLYPAGVWVDPARGPDSAVTTIVRNVTATPSRLTDSEIGEIWFAAKIPGLTETSARILIRAAEERILSGARTAPRGGSGDRAWLADDEEFEGNPSFG